MLTRIAGVVLISAMFVSGCAHSKKLQTDLDSCHAEITKLHKQGNALSDLASLANARANAYKDLARLLRDALGDMEFEIAIVDGRLVLRLPTAILFESGKAMIKPSGDDALKKVAGVLKTRDRLFIIAGHTDNVALRATDAGYESNRHLGWKRADNARKILVKHGMAEKQLVSSGFGEFFPVADNKTDAGKAENRRIEIIVLPKVSELPTISSDI